MQWLRGFAVCVAGLALAALALRLLNPLPSLDGRTASKALSPAVETAFGRSLEPLIKEHPGLNGIHLLPDAREAFASRAVLARSASRSIDVQYYIWHDDLTGGLLFDELRSAADRGVRVRLLLDDNNTDGLDELLSELDAHPNVELRLFNPFTIRRFRLAGYLTDFSRLNRRMHNKAFIIDNQVAIVGGRNIGDEYFGTGEGGLFVDLDALAVGPVVPQVSADFDRYWNSNSAYPADTILHSPQDLKAGVRTAPGSSLRARGADSYLRAIAALPLVPLLATGRLSFDWSPVHLISDDPSKALGRARDSKLMIGQLESVLGRPQKRLDLVSGYFVPTDATVDKLGQIARSGVQVTVVTNAFEATDVPVVHAGYAGDRKRLLHEGVKLWEIRADVVGRPRSPFPDSGNAGSVPSGSGHALHAKTFLKDRERLFIGSFNLDPRSARLNTELGLVIDSPVLAGRMEQRLRQQIPSSAYQLELTRDGKIIWIQREGGTTIIHRSEPGMTASMRVLISILSRLPIEWLL